MPTTMEGTIKRPRDLSFGGWERTIWDDIGPAAMGLDQPISEDFQNLFSCESFRNLVLLFSHHRKLIISRCFQSKDDTTDT